MSKILRTSNRINTRKNLTSTLKTNSKGLKQEEKKEMAMTTKEKRKRRHEKEENHINENKIAKEEQKENEKFSNNEAMEDIDEPSEYELLRQRNIEQRRLMFQQLDIEQVKGNMSLDNIAKSIFFKIGT